MKAVKIILENICFAVGLFAVIFVLTSMINGGKVSLYRNGEQVYCFSTNPKQLCTEKEEEPHEKSTISDWCDFIIKRL